MPSLRIVTEATGEPITVDDLKLHLGLDSTFGSMDNWFNSNITAARKEAENRIGRAVMPQTFKLFLDNFSTSILLPVAPLSTASGDVVITFLDSVSGDSTTLGSSVYRVDSDSEPGRIILDYEQEWPEVYPVRNAVQVQFVAGYKLNTAVTPATNTCPEAIKTWLKMRVASLYENREAFNVRGVQSQPGQFVDGLLDSYKLFEVDP